MVSGHAAPPPHNLIEAHNMYVSNLRKKMELLSPNCPDENKINSRWHKKVLANLNSYANFFKSFMRFD
jgi:hypothetical protein